MRTESIIAILVCALVIAFCVIFGKKQSVRISDHVDEDGNVFINCKIVDDPNFAPAYNRGWDRKEQK